MSGGSKFVLKQRVRRVFLRLVMIVGLVFASIGAYGFIGLDKILFGVYSAAARDTNFLTTLILIGGAIFFYAAFELENTSSNSDQ